MICKKKKSINSLINILFLFEKFTDKKFIIFIISNQDEINFLYFLNLEEHIFKKPFNNLNMINYI